MAVDYEGRVRVFNWVRDIHYRSNPNGNEPSYACLDKNSLLMIMLDYAGIDSDKLRRRICESKWSDFEKIPKSILNIPHQDRIFHAYLEFEENGRWHNLDASWDSGLGEVLPVQDWDGRTGTGLCFKPLRVFSPEDSLSILVDCAYFGREAESESEDYDFYMAFNKWLEDVRRRKV